MGNLAFFFFPFVAVVIVAAGAEVMEVGFHTCWSNSCFHDLYQ